MRVSIKNHEINIYGYYDFTKHVVFNYGVFSDVQPKKSNDLVTKLYVDNSIQLYYAITDIVNDTNLLDGKGPDYYTDIVSRLGFTPLNSSKKGVKNGYVYLDGLGSIGLNQINQHFSYVSSFPSKNNFPVKGTTGIIYLDEATNLTYRWNGFSYSQISGSGGGYEEIDKLKTPRLINGTAFDGTSDIVTDLWGNSRELKIGINTKQVNGSNSVNYTVNDIFGYKPVGQSDSPMEGSLIVNVYTNDDTSIVNKLYIDNLLKNKNNIPIPTGSMIPYDSSAITPAGFLKCNGAYVKKSDYNQLYNTIGDNYADLYKPGAGKPWKQQYNINNKQSFDLTGWVLDGNLPISITDFSTVVTKNNVYLVGGLTGNNISDLPVNDLGQRVLTLDSSGSIILPPGISNLTIKGKGGDGGLLTETIPEQPYVPQIGLPEYPDGLPPYLPGNWVTEVLNCDDTVSIEKSVYWKICSSVGGYLDPYDHFTVVSPDSYDRNKHDIESNQNVSIPVLCTEKYTESDGTRYIVLQTYIYPQGDPNYVDGLPKYRPPIPYSPSVTNTTVVNGSDTEIKINGSSYVFQGGKGAPATEVSYDVPTNPGDALTLTYTVSRPGYIILSFLSTGGSYSSPTNYVLSSTLNNGSVSNWSKTNEIVYNLTGEGTINLPPLYTRVVLDIKGADGKITTIYVGGNGYIPQVGSPDYPYGLPPYDPGKVILETEVFATASDPKYGVNYLNNKSFHEFVLRKDSGRPGTSGGAVSVYVTDVSVTYTEYFYFGTMGSIYYPDGLPPYEPAHYFPGNPGDLIPLRGNPNYPYGLPGFKPNAYLVNYVSYNSSSSNLPTLNKSFTDGPGIKSFLKDSPTGTNAYINSYTYPDGTIVYDYVAFRPYTGDPNHPYGLPPYEPSKVYNPGTPVNNIVTGSDSVVTINGIVYKGEGGVGVAANNKKYDIQLPITSNNTINYKIPTGGSCVMRFYNYSTMLPRSTCKSQTVLYNNNLYNIGGMDGNTGNSSINVTGINTDGTFKGWSQLPDMPFTVYNSHVITTLNKMYVIGGIINGSVSSDIYTCDINQDGTLGNWVLYGNLPKPVASSNIIATKNKIYLLGTDENYEVYKANLRSDGSIGDWVTEYIPFFSKESSVFVTTKCVYILGGKYKNNISSKVYIIPILEDGSLGSGYYGSDLPVPLCNFDIVATSTKLYIIGGTTSTGDLNSIYSVNIVGGSDDYSEYYSYGVSFANIDYFKLPDKKPNIDNYIGYIIKT